MENAAIAGAKRPQNAAIEGYVLNSGILPLYRVEAVPSDFDAAKPDVPLFRAPLYRATYCTVTRPVALDFRQRKTKSS